MIGSKGYKENSFKDSISYRLPRVTIFDVAEECEENRKNKQKEKNKNIGKEPGE